MNKNDYKWGSPEYKIANTIEELTGVLTDISKWRTEIGIIMPVEKVFSAGNVLCSIADYLNRGSSYYRYNKTFDKLDKEHIKICVENAKIHHDEIKQKIEETHAKNLAALENNKKLHNSIKSIFATIGIRETYSTYEYKTSRASKKTETVHTAGFISDLARNVITDDGYDYELNRLKEFIERVNKWEKDSLVIIEQAEKEKASKDKELRMLAKAMEIAAQNNIVYANNAELYEKVEEFSREKFRKENYSEGMPLDQSCCDNCSTWHYGSHRCSCGNRRLYLSIDGNFFDGYYGYVEAD